MVELFSAFQNFQPIKVLVVGDFMLDTYTTGKVQRISPEAPVSVLKVEEEKALPGGAGNVVLNLLSLGANVIPLGRVGRDAKGEELLQVMQKEGVSTQYLLKQAGYSTPVKNRMVASSQQILRVDWEKNLPISSSLEEKITQLFPCLLSQVDIVAVSDYLKGFLSSKLLKSLIQAAKKYHVPVIVDPKGKDFSKYKGATLIKPNQVEAYQAAHLAEDASIEEVAKKLQKITEIDHIFITRSEEGITLLSNAGKLEHFKAHKKEVKDVTGAGDTVLAVLCMAIGNKIDLADAAKLSNVAASIVIERLGCAKIKLSELARHLLLIDSERKIFHESHLHALQEALKEKPFSIIAMDSRQDFSPSLLMKLQKSEQTEEIIIFIKDANPDAEFINFLATLKAVNFILLKKESLQTLCKNLSPKSIYSADKKSLKPLKEFSQLISA